MVICFAPNCKHCSEKHTCNFFYFPSEPKALNLWIQLIRRKDRSPEKHFQICSCHFLNGECKNGPTLCDFNVDKEFSILDSKTTKNQKLSVCLEDQKPGSSGLSKRRTLFSEVYSSQPGCSGVFTTQNSTSVDTNNQKTEPQTSDMLETTNYFLKQELETLKKEVSRLRARFSYNNFKNNDNLFNFYTGLPTNEIFLNLFSLYENLEISYFEGWQVADVQAVDQLLLTLIKLKLNLHNEDLAFQFQISCETVANIFKTWLFALHEILFKQLMHEIPLEDRNKMCISQTFSYFTICRVFVDCTELSTVQSTRMKKQRLTYSSYSHGNTLKSLVGVAYDRVVTFVSSLYPYSTSNKKILAHCGITNELVPADFFLIPQRVASNSRMIARARVHVEKIMRRIQGYQILNMIRAPLIPYSSEIFQVCAALTNLQFPLTEEVSKPFDY